MLADKHNANVSIWRWFCLDWNFKPHNSFFLFVHRVALKIGLHIHQQSTLHSWILTWSVSYVSIHSYRAIELLERRVSYVTVHIKDQISEHGVDLGVTSWKHTDNYNATGSSAQCFWNRAKGQRPDSYLSLHVVVCTLLLFAHRLTSGGPP